MDNIMKLTTIFPQPECQCKPILKRGDRISKGNGEEYIIAVCPNSQGLFLSNVATGCVKNGHAIQCDKSSNITEKEILGMIGSCYPGLEGWVKTKDCE
jgi:hypothetical protein